MVQTKITHKQGDNKMRKSVFTTVMAAVFAVMAMTPAFAGSMDAPADPTSATSAMYTLESIYQRLATGAAGSKRVGPFAEPGAGPVATGHTLDQVMGLAPAVDAGGAGVADVANGKKFWGLKSGEWGVQTGTGTIATVPAPMPKTGQTTQYAAGDDGALQKGVASPSPRFTEPSVKDNLTGLIWLKNANCFSTRTWAQALSDAAGLKGDNTMCGLNDSSTAGQWRLPNLRELQSLIDLQNVSPALPTGHPFTGVQTSTYWSATTYADDTTSAWYMALAAGNVSLGGKTTPCYVWPVR